MRIALINSVYKIQNLHSVNSSSNVNKSETQVDDNAAFESSKSESELFSQSRPLEKICMSAHKDIKTRGQARSGLFKDFVNLFSYYCSSRKRRVIKQGNAIVDDHLDIVKFLENQIKFEIFLKLKATKLERYFIRNNHNFVLDYIGPN